MRLAPRSRLGPYEIASVIDAGGMGEVYRATDTRLDRPVALKIISGDFDKNPESRRRLQQEARAVSSLNHPHICTLHDVGHQDGIDYLVMELLEGETLADRLAKRPLSLDDALEHGAAIADGLDAIHRAGILHCDLKPSNIILTSTGAKLLDFGIARQRPRGAGAGTDQMSLTATEDQSISGTIQYMSPEQLEGSALDARSDIFSCGVILYEMVTGRRAFDGPSRAAVSAAVLTHDVSRPSTIQPLASSALDRVVLKCLARDPAARWQSASDLASELRWIRESTEVDPAARTSRRNRWLPVATLVAVFIALASTFLAFRRSNPSGTPAEPVSFSVAMPPGASVVSQGVLSPNGRWIVFATEEASTRGLRVRALNSVETHVLAGTEGAENPFWSPDSRFIGFGAQGKLKTIAVSGGAVTELATFPPGGLWGNGGGTWGADGTILFAPYLFSGLYRVSQSGGQATAVTTIEPSSGQRAHRWPQFLPDGRRFLFSVIGSGQWGLYVGSLDNSTQFPIPDVGPRALFASPGYLLFMRGGTLMAQRFDSGSLRLTGAPERVVDRVATRANNDGLAFSASDTGVLAYNTGDVATKRLVWYDRSGKQTGVYDASVGFNNPAFSPDETMVAASRLEADTNRHQLWLLDLRRSLASRFAVDASSHEMPLWSRDGTKLLFASGGDLYRQAADGSGPAELLLKSPEAKLPHDWASDGQHIVYVVNDSKTQWDIWLLPLFGDRRPKPYLQTPFSEYQGRISPDGRRIAYTSSESGTLEVYLQSFPSPGRKRLISTSGGAEPQWRRDGKELFYLSTDQQIMSVNMTDSAPNPAAPTPLFRVRVTGVARNHYLVTADGQRFLVSAVDSRSPTSITVALNWTSHLTQH